MSYASGLKNIPPKAEEYIKQNYPNAVKLKWHNVKAEQRIKVEFEFADKEVVILFDKDGNWKQLQQEIMAEQLPDSVKGKIPEGVKLESITEIRNNAEESFYVIIGKEKKYVYEIYSSANAEDFESHRHKKKRYIGVAIGMLVLIAILLPK